MIAGLFAAPVCRFFLDEEATVASFATNSALMLPRRQLLISE